MKLISIHALREEGDLSAGAAASHPSISIHALREEGDCGRSWTATDWNYFYPRPPRGGRLSCHFPGMPSYLFLSTLSVRRAT